MVNTTADVLPNIIKITYIDHPKLGKHKKGNEVFQVFFFLGQPFKLNVK